MKGRRKGEEWTRLHLLPHHPLSCVGGGGHQAFDLGVRRGACGELIAVGEGGLALGRRGSCAEGADEKAEPALEKGMRQGGWRSKGTPSLPARPSVPLSGLALEAAAR